MSLTVIDASIAHSWVLETQKTPAAFALRTLANATFIAPFVFVFEVRNGLARAERQDRLESTATNRALDLLHALVNFEAPPDDEVLAGALLLSRRHYLSFYDACYLEAALRLGATLASRDAPLIEAGGRENVAVYDAR